MTSNNHRKANLQSWWKNAICGVALGVMIHSPAIAQQEKNQSRHKISSLLLELGKSGVAMRKCRSTTDASFPFKRSDLEYTTRLHAFAACYDAAVISYSRCELTFDDMTAAAYFLHTLGASPQDVAIYANEILESASRSCGVKYNNRSVPKAIEDRDIQRRCEAKQGVFIYRTLVFRESKEDSLRSRVFATSVSALPDGSAFRIQDDRTCGAMVEWAYFDRLRCAPLRKNLIQSRRQSAKIKDVSALDQALCLNRMGG